MCVRTSDAQVFWIIHSHLSLSVDLMRTVVLMCWWIRACHQVTWGGGDTFLRSSVRAQAASQAGRHTHTHLSSESLSWLFQNIQTQNQEWSREDCLKISCIAWWASSYWTTSEPGPRKTLSWFRTSSWLSDHLCRLWHVRSHPRTFPLSHPRAYFLLPCAQRTGCHWSVRPEWKLFGVGPSPNECWRVVYMWLGVELKHADTLQTLWNEVK